MNSQVLFLDITILHVLFLRLSGRQEKQVCKTKISFVLVRMGGRLKQQLLRIKVTEINKNILIDVSLMIHIFLIKIFIVFTIFILIIHF